MYTLTNSSIVPCVTLTVSQGKTISGRCTGGDWIGNSERIVSTDYDDDVQLRTSPKVTGIISLTSTVNR